MKKTLMLLIVVLMTFAGTITAYAEESPQESYNPVAGYKGGVFIQNQDKSFVLKINGRLQPRVYFKTTGGSPSSYSFMVRRASVTFTANVYEKASFTFTLNHSTGSSEYSGVNIQAATASYEFMPEFVVTAGMVGLPLSINGTGSSLSFLTLDVPLIMTQQDGGTITPIRGEFGNPDGLGLNLSGQIWKFGYELAVINGAQNVTGAGTATPSGSGVESNYNLNFNKRVSAGARLSFDVLDSAITGSEMDLPYSEKPKLSVNIGGNYQGVRTDPTTAAQVKRILTGTAGSAFRWRGFALNAEVFGRRMTMTSLGTSTLGSLEMDEFGYYADTGYFVLPDKLELAALGAQIFREGPHNDSYQLGGGVNWYPKGSKNLKLQLHYRLTGKFDNALDAGQAKENYIGLQGQVAF